MTIPYADKEEEKEESAWVYESISQDPEIAKRYRDLEKDIETFYEEGTELEKVENTIVYTRSIRELIESKEVSYHMVEKTYKVCNIVCTKTVVLYIPKFPLPKKIDINKNLEEMTPGEVRLLEIMTENKDRSEDNMISVKNVKNSIHEEEVVTVTYETETVPEDNGENESDIKDWDNMTEEEQLEYLFGDHDD